MKPTSIAAILKELFDPDTLKALNADTGFIERERVIDLEALLWTLVLGRGAQRRLHLASLHRLYMRRCGAQVAYSCLRDKLNKPACADFLQRCVDRVCTLATSYIPRFKASNAAMLSDALAVDSTVVTLHKALRPIWKATWKDGAALKLHAVHNVVHGCTVNLRISQGTEHDAKDLRQPGPWLKGLILMGDLAFWSLPRFKAIDANAGFFISRLKGGVKVEALSDNASPGPGSMDVAGKSLDELTRRLRRHEVDLKVLVGDERVQMRLVGRKHPETGKYHFYVTNIDAEQMDVRWIGELYRLRWQVELLFKALRSIGRLDQMVSSSPNIIRTLVWSAVLGVLLGQMLAMMAREHAGAVRGHARLLRFQLVWQELQLEVLCELIKPVIDAVDDLSWLYQQACDPNHSRGRPTDVLTKFRYDGLPFS